MKVHHVLFFFFLSAPAVHAVFLYTGPEGGNGTLDCSFVSGSTKFFCKNDCKGKEDVLIKTDGSTAQNGRYSIKYSDSSSGRGSLHVTITHLTQSDSGLYRCGLGRGLVLESYTDFEVRVSDELLDKTSGFIYTTTQGQSLTWGCSYTVYGDRKFFCKDQCQKLEDVLIYTDKDTAQNGRYSILYVKGSVPGLHVSISQLTKVDSGWYGCGYGNPLSPDSFYRFQVLVVDGLPDGPDYSVPLVVCVLCLLVVFLLVIFFVMRRRKFGSIGKGKTNQTNTEVSVTYENDTAASTREDSAYQSLSPSTRDQDQTYTALVKTELSH
ncbi:polymeric immunoglobulin receptor-like isoform X2 [Parambassis ranga]|uniref:polymeric immunoglobulin receptor-like isoform X2 n=1 Tax=Parambassis ranga TaxID=210632 RepID=UPI001042121E|nr:polymeric immunoglobulin receptor-like isoform X2 [Parambassis ranga]